MVSDGKKSSYILNAWPIRSRTFLSSPFQESRSRERSNPKARSEKRKNTKTDHYVMIHDQNRNDNPESK